MTTELSAIAERQSRARRSYLVEILRQFFRCPKKRSMRFCGGIFSVKGKGLGRRGCRWNDGFDASKLEPFPKRVGVIGFICQEPLRAHIAEIGMSQQWDGDADISDVSGCQREGDRSAVTICQTMDFRCTAAARAPGRLFELPFCAGCETVCAGMGAVDHDFIRFLARSRRKRGAEAVLSA